MFLNKVLKKWGSIQNEIGFIILTLTPLYFSNFIASKINAYWDSFCNLGFSGTCGSTYLNTPSEIAEGFLVIFLLFLAGSQYLFDENQANTFKNQGDTEHKKNNKRYRLKKISFKTIIFILIFLSYSFLLILEKSLIIYGFSAIILLLILKSDTFLTKAKDIFKPFQDFLIPFFSLIICLFLFIWILADIAIFGINSYYNFTKMDITNKVKIICLYGNRKTLNAKDTPLKFIKTDFDSNDNFKNFKENKLIQKVCGITESETIDLLNLNTNSINSKLLFYIIKN